MQNQLFKWCTIGVLNSFILFISSVYSQIEYPYSSGQAVFVQSPYNSSLYTNYNYNPHESAPQRLPAYTTNQAVFVQQPYATTQQTITSYPSSYYNSLPRTENRYMSPAAYPSTVAPAYPYGNVGLYISSPYTTTSQTSTYQYPYAGRDYTTTYTYPYTTSSEITTYPNTTVERVPAYGSYASGYSGYGAASVPRLAYPSSNIQQLAPAYPMTVSPGFPSTTYNAYPISTADQYPYPTTTTAVPETVIEPIRPLPVRRSR